MDEENKVQETPAEPVGDGLAVQEEVKVELETPAEPLTE